MMFSVTSNQWFQLMGIIFFATLLLIPLVRKVNRAPSGAGHCGGACSRAEIESEHAQYPGGCQHEHHIESQALQGEEGE